MDVGIFAEIPAYAQRLQILTRALPCFVVFQATDNELLRSEEGKANCDERNDGCLEAGNVFVRESGGRPASACATEGLGQGSWGLLNPSVLCPSADASPFHYSCSS